ncbi:hypothetical protein GOODEAATRI_019933 [Goodea atripinnis]|uniref:Uncharacterized protein n=1 Tax=Goodea atripinnis TaxID=208336 RepID=A0ABV0PZM4_9TELE
MEQQPRLTNTNKGFSCYPYSADSNCFFFHICSTGGSTHHRLMANRAVEESSTHLSPPLLLIEPPHSYITYSGLQLQRSHLMYGNKLFHTLNTSFQLYTNRKKPLR